MVIDSTLSDNGAFVKCYNNCTAAGGGIYNSGTAMVIGSTLSGNKVSAVLTMQGIGAATGGGIFNTGTLTISNSTINGNSTFLHCKGFCIEAAGGVLNGSTVTINNSTFSGNSSGHLGGGIFSDGTTTLQNSIVANSPSGGNCSGTMTSSGYNLSSDNTCNFNNTGDLNNTDPKLGQLGNYGGPTQTIPLLTGSPAIDAGNPSGCTDGRGHLLKTDQRGKPRPDHEDTGGCDMGAYERQKD